MRYPTEANKKVFNIEKWKFMKLFGYTPKEIRDYFRKKKE